MAQESDLERIRSVVVRVTHQIDRKDASSLRALYADEVDTDYCPDPHSGPDSATTKLGGWPDTVVGTLPAQTSLDRMTAAWAKPKNQKEG